MKRAYILCSGFGKKIWPFSDIRPKCCIPIGNKPNIVRIIKMLKECGIDEIVVIAGYKSSQVHFALRDEKGIVIIDENQNSGSAFSLLKAVENDTCRDFLVVYSDSVIGRDSIKKIIQDYENFGPSIMVQKLEDDLNAVDWICADVSNESISSIYGHPRPHYVNTRVAGVFALNSSIIHYLKCNPGLFANVPVGGMPNNEAVLEQSIQMMIEEGLDFHATFVSDYFVDLDRPWDILEGNVKAIDDMFKENDADIIGENSYIDDSAIIEGRVIMGKGSSIGRNVIIKGDVFIGNNTIIDYGAILEGKNVIGNNTIIKDYSKIWQYTTIGNKNKIGYNAEICGVTFDGVCAVHNTELTGIIGCSTDIAAGCMTGTLRFDDRAGMHNIASRKVVGNRFSSCVFIGDYTRTGVSNIFYPGVKIGTNCAIGPGAIVDSDIESGTLLLVKQEKVYEKWGPEKYGW